MGQEIYTMMAASETLKVRPRWALAVIASLRKTGWVAIESWSLANVEALCHNISTIQRPMDIRFVPLEERLDWLVCGKQHTKPKSPGWARFKPASVLRSLNLKPSILRYAKELALVTSCVHYPFLDVLVIPRLPVSDTQSGPENQTRTRKRTRQRLLHPYTFPSKQEERRASDFHYDPSLFWFPTKEPKLMMTRPNVYRFSKKNSPLEYKLPFAWFERVPTEALAVTEITPAVGELDAFFEGIIVGQKELQLSLPPGIPQFIRFSYDYYLGAPLEVGHRVIVQALPASPEMGGEVIAV